MMLNFRKLLCRPQVDDWSPLAKFFFADEALNSVAAELDAFDSRRQPDRCQQLMAKLRSCQDRVLEIIEEMLTDVFPDPGERAPRDYRVKFPDDVLHESFPGQLWFAAECLAAGSNIVDRDFESDALRPLAKSLSRHVDELRDMLKVQSLKNPAVYPPKLRNALLIFDHLFAEFELNYVSTMVPVKTAREYELLLEMAVLFSETLMRAQRKGFINSEQVEACDPIVMFSLPRLVIVSGLIVYPDGPFNMDRPASNSCDMLRPFRTLLQKIRDFLLVLDANELNILESKLSSTVDAELSAKEVSLFSDFCKRKRQERKHELDATSVDDVCSASCSDVSYGVLSPDKPVSKSDSNNHGDGIIEGAIKVVAPATPRDTSRSVQNWRANYRSSSDLIHRLFVCIAGIADQWQSTYPSDLRIILKMILHPEPDEANGPTKVFEEVGQITRIPGSAEETGVDAAEPSDMQHVHAVFWVPDEECDSCTCCQVRFSFVRRRHHCRSCGNIFCARCSANFTPLPTLGYRKPVRVCDQCFQFSTAEVETN